MLRPRAGVYGRAALGSIFTVSGATVEMQIGRLEGGVAVDGAQKAQELLMAMAA